MTNRFTPGNDESSVKYSRQLVAIAFTLFLVACDSGNKLKTNSSPDQPTDQTMEQNTNQPADQGTNQTTDQSTDQTSDQSTDQTSDQDTDQTSDQGADQTSDQSTDQTSDQGTDQTSDQGTDQTSDQGTDQTSDQGTDQTSDQGTDQTSDQTPDQTSDGDNNQTADSSAESNSADASNLLSNHLFNDTTNGQANNWQTFCGGGSSVASTDGNSVLQVFDGACVSQFLDAADVALMRGEVFELACNVEFNSSAVIYEQYATISLTIDGIEYQEDIPRRATSRVRLTVLTPETASSGYVTIYSENEPGSLKVFDCSLQQFDSGSGNSFGDPENNLLTNGGFDEIDNATGLPRNWQRNCYGGNDGGTYTSINSPFSAAGLELDKSDQSVLPCAWTILSPDAIAKLKHNTFSLSCDAWNYSQETGSAWMDIRYSTTSSNINQDIRLLFEDTGYYEPFTTSGHLDDINYAKVYLFGNHLRVDNCFLEATGDNTNRSSIDVRAHAEGPDGYAVDGPFTFDVVLTNNGDQPLQNVVYNSPEIDCEGTVATLAVGESLSAQCSSPTILDSSNTELTITVNASAVNSIGETMADNDTVNYFFTNSVSQLINLKVRALTKTILAGQDATVEVTVSARGKGDTIPALESNFSQCAKTYATALTTGQYDVYECTIPNVQSTTEVTVTPAGYASFWGSTDEIYVYEE